MTMLLEDPMYAISAVVAIELILLAAIFVTGRGILLGLMALVALIGAGLIILERVVVTEREQVENVLDEISRALETNDVDQVLVYVSPQANDIRQLVRRTLPRVVIREVLITGDLHIDVNMQAAPPTAVARFIGRIQGNLKHGGAPYESFVRRFEVTFQQHDDHWVVTAFKDHDVR